MRNRYDSASHLNCKTGKLRINSTRIENRLQKQSARIFFYSFDFDFCFFFMLQKYLRSVRCHFRMDILLFLD